MSAQRFTPEFKEEAVKQVTERGYSVAEVAARLGVSTHSLYKWVKAASPGQSEQHSQELLQAKSEILRLRSQMRRIEEERDILKNGHRTCRTAPLNRNTSRSKLVSCVRKWPTAFWRL